MMAFPKINVEYRELFKVEGCDIEFTSRQDALDYALEQFAVSFIAKAKLDGVYHIDDIFKLPHDNLKELLIWLKLILATDHSDMLKNNNIATARSLGYLSSQSSSAHAATNQIP